MGAHSRDKPFGLYRFLGLLPFYSHDSHGVQVFHVGQGKVGRRSKHGDPGMDSKIKKYLAYPVSWSAEHVDAQGGKKSWAEVATSNPWESKEQK